MKIDRYMLHLFEIFEAKHTLTLIWNRVCSLSSSHSPWVVRHWLNRSLSRKVLKYETISWASYIVKLLLFTHRMLI